MFTKTLSDKCSLLDTNIIRRISDRYMARQPQAIQDKYYEYLSVFDEDENYIGSANWYFAHKFGYIYSGNGVLICNEVTGEILLQKRSPNVSWPNLLDCSAGGCFPAEVKDEGSRLLNTQREIQEELFSNQKNLIDIELKKIGRTFIDLKENGFIKKQFMHVYLMNLKETLLRKISESNETSGLIWITKENLLKLPKNQLAPGLLTVLSDNQILSEIL
jgi:hypothetical protein